ncbi:HNH endonuclease [Cellulomonas algicola]|uniref:HNH endonuclease n=1 Tax=Cellulomonas algicola TaxID=2071633 RepID=UPI001C3FA2DD|nr:HNH endonuclease [Cellulomonas algicola]
MTSPERAAWSCFTNAAEELLGMPYADELGRSYAYDSNVVNHKQVRVGDILVVRDRQLVLGFGTVDDIETRAAEKPMLRCPRCGRSGLAQRAKALPRFRCNDCGHTFDEPVVVPKHVTAYVAHYGAWWMPFESPAPLRSLDGLYTGKDQQNAIRRLDPSSTLAFLEYQSSGEGAVHAQILRGPLAIQGGLVEAVVRRRIGQQQFRRHLLDRYGSVCAVTGTQPEPVLDAAHLYTFAERPEHDDDGGLLLRADVHRLFDRLLLTFDPATWRSRVAPALLDRHERLRSLDDVAISVPDGLLPSEDLVARHHDSARARWRELAPTS